MEIWKGRDFRTGRRIPKRVEVFQESAQKRSESQKLTTDFKKKKAIPASCPSLHDICQVETGAMSNQLTYEHTLCHRLRCVDVWRIHTSYTTFGVRRTDSILQTLWDQKPLVYTGAKMDVNSNVLGPGSICFLRVTYLLCPVLPVLDQEQGCLQPPAAEHQHGESPLVFVDAAWWNLRP